MKTLAIVLAMSLAANAAMADDFGGRWPGSQTTQTTTVTKDGQTTTTTVTTQTAPILPPASQAKEVAPPPAAKAIPQQAPPRARRPSYYPRAYYIERDCCLASSLEVPADRVNRSYNPSCNGIACY